MKLFNCSAATLAALISAGAALAEGHTGFGSGWGWNTTTWGAQEGGTNAYEAGEGGEVTGRSMTAFGQEFDNYARYSGSKDPDCDPNVCGDETAEYGSFMRQFGASLAENEASGNGGSSSYSGGHTSMGSMFGGMFEKFEFTAPAAE